MASSYYKQLKAEYTRLAKRADKRMARLEALAKQPGYESVTDFAYARAVRDIQAWDKKAKKTYKSAEPRFQRNIPKNTKSLEAKIADVQNFLNARSSTKSGIVNIYEKAAQTTNERYGTDFTWADITTYYETVQSKHNDAKYGSKTLIKAIAVIKNIGPDPEAIREAKRKNTKLSEDDVVDEIAKKLLKGGQTSTKLFGR